MRGLPLTFQRLRKKNVKRCRIAFHKVEDWSPCDWATAMGGECGEACNLTKKMLRGDRGGPKDIQELGKEIADVVVYADLLAAAAGINLENAIIHKFNEVSDRKNSKIKL